MRLFGDDICGGIVTFARQPLCYVLDDEPAMGRFVALAVRAHGVAAEAFVDLPSLMQALH